MKDNEKIQEGLTKRYPGEVSEKVFVKKDKQLSLLKVAQIQL